MKFQTFTDWYYHNIHPTFNALCILNTDPTKWRPPVLFYGLSAELWDNNKSSWDCFQHSDFMNYKILYQLKSLPSAFNLLLTVIPCEIEGLHNIWALTLLLSIFIFTVLLNYFKLKPSWENLVKNLVHLINFIFLMMTFIFTFIPKGTLRIRHLWFYCIVLLVKRLNK